MFQQGTGAGGVTLYYHSIRSEVLILIPWFKNRIIRRGGEGGGAAGCPVPVLSPVPIPVPSRPGPCGGGRGWGTTVVPGCPSPQGGCIPRGRHQPLAAPQGFGHPGLCGKGPKRRLGEGDLSSQGFSSRKSGRRLLVAVTVALAVPFDCLQMHISITRPLKSHLPRSIPMPLFLID